MFAWVQHLVEEGYFRKVEIFYLFAGHTHSPIDQNFSVVHNAINRSKFIGSTIAMHELFKVAHDIEDEKSKLSRITEVIPLDIYHDYVKWYEPVMNPLIRNHQGPHRFLIEYLERWGRSDVRYMWQSSHIAWENNWLPARPIPAHDSMEKAADIELTQFSIFGGQDHMLSALQVKTGEKVGDILGASTQSSTAASANIGNVGKVMPSIRQIEYGALAELTTRYAVEANSGRLAQGVQVRAPKSMVAEVEEEMLSQNTQKEGHLVFLKRSLCSDPNWQDTRPDILPNPKRWLEESGSSLEAITANNSAFAEAEEIAEKTKKKRTKEETDNDKTVTRLLKFNSGAGQMAKTAKYMLELLNQNDVRIRKSDSNDIISATDCFNIAVLTKRDQIFYENISSVANIRKIIEIRVAEAEAEAWKLLRLPDLPKVKQRRELLKAKQETIYKAKQESISKVLGTKTVFDITKETITRDGKETVYAKNMEDMTIEQLKIIIGAAKVPGRSKFKTKVQLIEAIKKYLSEHPEESLKSLCGEEGEDAQVVAVAAGEHQETNSSSGASNTSSSSSSIQNAVVLEEKSQSCSNVPISVVEMSGTDEQSAVTASDNTIATLCPVEECVDPAVITCEQCQLSFCTALHGSHNSHICQVLKAGYKFAGEWEAPARADNDPEEIKIIRLVPKKIPVELPPRGVSSSSAAVISVTTPGMVPSIEESAAEKSLESSTQHTIGGKRKNILINNEELKNTHKKATGELTKEAHVAKIVRNILETTSGPRQAEALYLHLNYDSYDILFLQNLSHEFDVDISHALSSSRPKRARVLEELINLIVKY